MSKKALHDKIIIDMAALTLPGGALAFASVKKAPLMNIPAQSAEVGITTTSSNVEGISFDSRIYTFTVSTHENFDAADTEAQLESKIDRMSYIEDAVFDYLQALPSGASSNLAGTVAGLNIYKIETQPATYLEGVYDSGVAKYLTITFRVFVLIDVRSL